MAFAKWRRKECGGGGGGGGGGRGTVGTCGGEEVEERVREANKDSM